MVVRLEGKVQGQDVIFNKVQGDEWETIIPPALNGVYIVELTAYDDAGNVSYTAKYIMTIDLTGIRTKVRINRIDTRIHLSQYCSNVRLSKYYAKARCCSC